MGAKHLNRKGFLTCLIVKHVLLFTVGVKKMVVKKGDTVKVEYVGQFEDGTIFDSSETHGQALSFTMGEGRMIPGFEKAVLGMKQNEEKDIVLEVEDAYGQPHPEFIKEVPREQLPKDQEPKAGMMLAVGLPNGQQIPALITKVTPTMVTIDMNHPLAGKVLKFHLKVVGISSAA